MINIYLIIFTAVIILYFYLLFFSKLLEKFHTLNLLLLFVLGGLAIKNCIFYVQYNKVWYVSLISIVSLFFAIFFVLMFLIKFYFLPETRNRSSHSLLRNMTSFSIPYRRLKVKTADNLDIAAYHVENNHEELIIVCHGGVRSKNILGNIMLCEWLAQEFDVITFDFRGHYESDGKLSIDGKTVDDLKAIVQYAISMGYKKIGILGRSLGGWTAILYASQYHDISSVAIAGSPIGNLYAGSILPRLPRFILPLMQVISRILLGFRFSRNFASASPIDEIHKISPVPILLIYCENDKRASTAIPDVKKLYSKANEPKKLVVFEGHGHILESRYLNRYYLEARNWFLKTLKEVEN